MRSGIYSITNTTNGHIYIGSTSDMKRRWRAHRHRLNTGIHGNTHLQNAWKKYTSAAFVFEQLASCSVQDLMQVEQWFLDRLPAESYNIARVAGMSTRGSKWTEDRYLKHRKALERSDKRTWNARISASLKGRSVSVETREKIAKALTGKPFTNERLLNMSKAKKGIPWSAARRAAQQQGKL